MLTIEHDLRMKADEMQDEFKSGQAECAGRAASDRLTAYISPEARIGRNVKIGLQAHIHACAEIGDGSTIGDFCIIGHPSANGGKPTVIGPGSVVRSHSIVYEDVILGPNFQGGHHGLVREGTRAGINLRMGSFSDIEGDCQIGDYCRFHGYVHVGRGSQIGNFVWLYSQTTLMNDPLPPSHVELPVTIEDGVVVCLGSLVMPGALLRCGSFVCSGARVSGEVPAGSVVDAGSGKAASHVSLLVHMESKTAHPWMRHFHDAYPPEAQDRIQALYARIMSQRQRPAAQVQD